MTDVMTITGLNIFVKMIDERVDKLDFVNIKKWSLTYDNIQYNIDCWCPSPNHKIIPQFTTPNLSIFYRNMFTDKIKLFLYNMGNLYVTIDSLRFINIQSSESLSIMILANICVILTPISNHILPLIDRIIDLSLIFERPTKNFHKISIETIDWRLLLSEINNHNNDNFNNNCLCPIFYGTISNIMKNVYSINNIEIVHRSIPTKFIQYEFTGNGIEFQVKVPPYYIDFLTKFINTEIDIRLDDNCVSLINQKDAICLTTSNGISGFYNFYETSDFYPFKEYIEKLNFINTKFDIMCKLLLPRVNIHTLFNDKFIIQEIIELLV